MSMKVTSVKFAPSPPPPEAPPAEVVVVPPPPAPVVRASEEALDEIEVPSISQMASRKRQWSSPISNQSTVQQLADDVEKAGILDGVDVPDDIDDYEDMLLATGLDEVAPPSGSRRRCSSVSEGGALERSGFLHKKSGALSGLRRRYFHLPPCGTLLWYKSEKDKEPTGFCHLASVTIVEHGAAGAGSRASYAQTTGGRPGFTLRGRKDYTLIADDEQERDS